MLIAAEAYPGFCSTKRLEVFLLLLDGMLVHRRSLTRNLSGFPNNCSYPFIHLGGERHCESKVSCPRTQCPRPGIEPGQLALESSALTMRPPRLPQNFNITNFIFLKLRLCNESRTTFPHIKNRRRVNMSPALHPAPQSWQCCWYRTWHMIKFLTWLQGGQVIQFFLVGELFSYKLNKNL